MAIKDRFMAGLARQLGKPEGVRGRVVGRRLNKINAQVVAAAVEAAMPVPGQAAADVGFGGGVGLQLLLDRVGADGHVHGVDVSQTMLKAASRRYRRACSEHRLSLHEGTITDLPLADSSVDALITVNTLYFVDDVELAFAETARVLRPSGRAVIGIGDPAMMARLPFTPHGFRLRPVEELVAALARAGLGDVRDDRVGHGDGAFHLLVAARD